MRRTVWVILLGGLVLAVVMQARTVVERRHFDEDMPATIQSETRALKVRGIPGAGSVTIADATPEIPRKSKSSSSRKRNPPLPERDEIVWTKTVESDKLPKSAAYEDALDRARNALTHEFNLSQPPSRDFINKRVKVDYTEKEGPNDSVIGETYSVKMDLQLTGETWRELAESERDYRVKDRMETLIRFSLVAVALLTCIAGYIRLDEYTKGYYTGRLRLVALATAAVATLSAINI